jgi:hypothetical protein
MPPRKRTSGTSPRMADWLRLQRRFALRASEYVEALAGIAAKGSFEPGEYIGQSAQLWANVIGDIGDWLKPQAHPDLEPSQALITRVKGQVLARRGTGTVRFHVPVDLFEDDDDKLELYTDGLIRKFAPQSAGRPVLMLEPETHLKIRPSVVKRAHPRWARLSVYDVPDTILAGQLYEGLIWATVRGSTHRLPVAAVELRIV